MKIKEAIILAGGLGTRLRSVLTDLPKCMAPVAGKPFLFYLINYLKQQGIEKFIFSLGYKHEIIQQYLLENFSSLNMVFVVEEEPLGTGGAAHLACTKATEEDVLLLNGDTFFKIDIRQLEDLHFTKQADCTISLKPMHNFDRYGVVELDSEAQVKRFREKEFYKEGLINGGIYILNVRSFLQQHFPARFSFENDYLKNDQHKLYGSIQDNYFIDIGIPEDLGQAQTELLKNI